MDVGQLGRHPIVMTILEMVQRLEDGQLAIDDVGESRIGEMLMRGHGHPDGPGALLALLGLARVFTVEKQAPLVARAIFRGIARFRHSLGASERAEVDALIRRGANAAWRKFAGTRAPVSKGPTGQPWWMRPQIG